MKAFPPAPSKRFLADWKKQRFVVVSAVVGVVVTLSVAELDIVQPVEMVITVVAVAVAVAGAVVDVDVDVDVDAKKDMDADYSVQQGS